MVKYKEDSFVSDSELVCLTIAEKTVINVSIFSSHEAGKILFISVFVQRLHEFIPQQQ